MKKIRSWFATPKKAAVTIVCVILIVGVLCAGGAYAVSAITQSSAIGAENAKNFAFADAGIDPASARQVKAEFSHEQGQFVYEVEFTAEGTEYEYWIRASDGAVVKRELKTIAAQNGASGAITAEITADRALEIALADAGVSESEAAFTKKKLDYEDGVAVYDIEFSADNANYEYEINAETGAVSGKSVETIRSDPGPGAGPSAQGASETPASQTPVSQAPTASAPAQSGRISLEEAKGIALADAGVSESEAAFTREKLDYEDGIAVYDIEFYTASYQYEYEIDAGTGAIRDRDVEAAQTAPAATEPAAEAIGTERAKEIAAEHAGLSASGVTFSKVKLDREDGAMVYEVEFYSGGVEYEYTIDASTGTILEYDSERED